MRRHQIVLSAVFVCSFVGSSEARRHRTSSAVRVFTNADEVFQAVSATYRVPEGLLRGIWNKESSELAGGWRTAGGDWFLARSLIRPEGECFKQYPQKRERCVAHWRALVALCAQRYKNGLQKGKRMCNPYQVYTSYAFAMGPMQHEPAEHVERVAGTWRYTDISVDFDRNGVFDPHTLADAVAATAVELKKYKHDPKSNGTWRWAVNRYYGSQKGGYYDGRWEWKEKTGTVEYRHGVHDYSIAWCKKHRCQSVQARR